MRPSGQKRRGAAHAEANNTERASAFEIALCGSHVGHHVIPVEIAEIAAGMSDLVWRIAAFEIAHETVKHRRRDRDIAERCEPVADRTNVVIDPENLLHHHHAALRRSRGIGAVSAERVLVGGGQSELLTQRYLP